MVGRNVQNGEMATRRARLFCCVIVNPPPQCVWYTMYVLQKIKTFLEKFQYVGFEICFTQAPYVEKTAICRAAEKILVELFYRT